MHHRLKATPNSPSPTVTMAPSQLRPRGTTEANLLPPRGRIPHNRGVIIQGTLPSPTNLPLKGAEREREREREGEKEGKMETSLVFVFALALKKLSLCVCLCVCGQFVGSL